MSVDVAGRSDAGLFARRRRLGDRIVAVVVSLAFHLMVFLVAFGTLRGGTVTGGGGGEPDSQVQAITISLAGLHRAPRPELEAQSTDALKLLFAKIRSEQSEIAISNEKPTPESQVQKLFDVIDPQTPNQSDKGAGRSDLDEGGPGASADAPKSDAVDKGASHSSARQIAGPGADRSAGELWGQIAPCWAHMPQVSTVPVTLEMTINDEGQIAVPPKIIRPDATAANEGRLVSEARALGAVSACVPYNTPVAGGGLRVFRVDFVPPKASREARKG
jgi:hypothetical protein